ALAFSACNKDKQTAKLEKTFPGPMDTGYLEAYRDGDFWQSTAEARYGQTAHFGVLDSTHLGFICFTYSKEGFLREYLTLSEIPLQIGKYSIKRNYPISAGFDGFVGAHYSWGADDGDVFGADYYHDDEYTTGVFEVTFVDLVSKRIVGNFDRLVFKNRYEAINYPERVVFEHGKFDMIITE
ncbi:MAG: hypothetical protein ACKVT2_15480, partial [Saprospiraceae bacterium]